jgi:L-alanine-DL-glutamate epimerase-like enolase superfamily enzyme
MPPERMIEEALNAAKQGISTLKVKVGLDPKQDVRTVRAIRDAVGEDTTLRVDANQAWSVGTAISQLSKLEECGIQYVEQPLPRWDHDGLAKLRSRCSVPICICEGLASLPQLLQLIKKDVVDFVSTDPVRTGGLLGFRKFCSVAEAAGIPVVTHVPALGVSVAAWLHATICSRPCMYACDIPYPGWDIGSWPPVDDIINESFQQQDGFLEVGDGIGLGVSLDLDRLRKWEEHYIEIRKKPISKQSYVDRYGKENAPTLYYMPPRF